VLSVTVHPAVQPGQRVTLLLNQTTMPSPTTPPAAYTFSLSPITAASNTLTCDVSTIAAGLYYIRVKIDGAESPLDLNPASPTPAVTVTIP
jgi:hypothetical protein